MAELAQYVGATVRGDAAQVIHGVATLQSAEPGQISFFSNSRYRKYLGATRATAVILSGDDADDCNTSALVVANPYVAFARIASLFAPPSVVTAAIHPNAVVDAAATIDASASIGPGVCVEAGAVIAAGARIGANCVIGRDVQVGVDSVLEAQVTVWHGTHIGKRALIHPGVVIGADGFGLANDNGVWIKVPQLGRVIIGDDVEIGANTTIDRGAIEDTVIEDGVKLDNLIQIGHNVHIGAHTAIAACTAVAGSTKIGKYCGIGGTVGIVGHLEIADRVQITGMSMVTQSITEPGTYSSGTPLEPNAHWRKNFVRFKHLDDMWRQLKQLEAELNQLKGKG